MSFRPPVSRANESSQLERVFDSPLYPMLHWLLRWRYVVITAVAYVFCLAHLDARGDWEFFVQGSRLLFGEHRVHSLLPGGFRLYAFYPHLQIGPLALLVATPFRVFGEDSRGAVAVVLTAVAPALIYLLERMSAIRYPAGDRVALLRRHAVVLIGGVVVAPSWSQLGTAFTHVDDVLVLSLSCIAMWAVLRERPLVLGVALGCAVAAKPWAVIMFPLLLVLRGRDQVRAAVTAVSISAIAWLPFILADHYTLEALRPNTDVAPASVIHLFGVSLEGFPTWIRPAQLLASLAVGTLAVRRGRWPAVLVVGIAARLLLDPGVWSYYSSGMILAALAWDLLRSDSPAPTWTLMTFACLDLTTNLTPTMQAMFRLLVTTALIASVLLGPDRRRSRPEVTA